MNADKLADALREYAKKLTADATKAEDAGMPNKAQILTDIAYELECLAAHDAQPAQAGNSLLIGTTPAGRPYGLHGTRESVEAVSDLIEAQATQPVGVPDGWVMVPKRDVTSDMIRVGMEWITNCQTDFDRACMVTCIFGEMCKVAPQPPSIDG